MTMGKVSEKINSGKTPLGGESTYTTDGVVFIRSQNVNNDKLELDNAVFISEEVNRAMKNSVVKSNDILLNITGASLGRSCVVPNDFKTGNVNQHVCIIRLKDNYSSRFIQPIFSSSKGQSIFLSLQTGSGREGLNFESIKSIELDFPAKEEQEKIAPFLTLIDQRIETQSQIIEELETLIKEACKRHYQNAEKKEYLISDLGEPFSTMNLSKADLSDDGNECILYGELFTIYGCVIDKVKSFTKRNAPKTSLSEENDLLFPSSTTVNALSLITPSAITQKGVILGGDMFGIHLYKEFNNEYLSYAINYLYKDALAKYAKGSTIIHLHYSDIKKFKIMLPSFEQQEVLASLLRLIRNKTTLEKQNLALLTQLKQYMLKNLFI